jgi:large subunit ribosomal protein L32e
MADEIRRRLKVRRSKEARFKRVGVDKKKTIRDSWRRPRGLHSKQRMQARPRVHIQLLDMAVHSRSGVCNPSGLKEVRVWNLTIWKG